MIPNGRHPFSLGLASAGTAQRIGAGRGIRTGRAGRADLLRDRRAFAVALSAALAGVGAAALFGAFAPLHSTG